MTFSSWLRQRKRTDYKFWWRNGRRLSSVRSFKIHTARLEEPRILLGLATGWKTKAPITASRGLAKAGDETLLHGRTADATSHLFTVMDLFTVMALPSRTCLLRALSECPALTRNRAEGDLITGERLERRAAIGLADRELIIGLNRRKHMSAGTRMERVRICEDFAPESLELHVPHLSCAVRRLLPATTRVARAGDSPLPD